MAKYRYKDRVMDLLPEQTFEFPTDVGHMHICDLCGIRIYNGFCGYCGREYGESSVEMRNPGYSHEGFSAMMEALR